MLSVSPKEHFHQSKGLCCSCESSAGRTHQARQKIRKKKDIGSRKQRIPNSRDAEESLRITVETNRCAADLESKWQEVEWLTRRIIPRKEEKRN